MKDDNGNPIPGVAPAAMQMGRHVASLLKEERRLEQSTEQSAPVDLDEPIGRLSRMDAIQSQHMAQAGMNREQRQLLMVREALERLETPDFGRCRNCSEPIGFDRLGLDPALASGVALTTVTDVVGFLSVLGLASLFLF